MTDEPEEDEYPFDPETVEHRRGRTLDPAPLIVGGFVGLAGVLMLLEPVVNPVAVGELRLRPVALSAVSLTVGLLLGGGIYLRRGRRLVGLAHGVTGVGWALTIAGTAVGSGTLLLFGLAVVVGGSLALATQLRTLA